MNAPAPHDRGPRLPAQERGIGPPTQGRNLRLLAQGRSLRWRIGAAIAGACLFTVFAIGAILYEASEALEASLVDQMVLEEVDFLAARHRTNPDYRPVPAPHAEYYIVRNEEEAARLPAYARNLAPGKYEIDLGNGQGDRDIAVRRVGATRYIVVYNIGPYEQREREYRQLAGLALLAGVAIALLLGYLLAGLISRQLTTLAGRVQALDPRQPQAPLAQPGLDIEVAVLARALDSYQTRIAEMMRREQEFTANASHELRTPLTAVRSSAELLALEPALSDKARERIGYIRLAADQMSEQIRALLFLAREQSLAEREVLSLRECVIDAAAPLRTQAAAKGLEFVNAVPEEAQMEANRQALHLVLANLLKNAVLYTESGHVRVEYANDCLRVIDSGVGMEAGQLTQVFERGYRGDASSDGAGICLDIVRRICEQCGWRIEAQSRPGEGSAFVVDLRTRQRPGPGATSAPISVPR